MQPIILFYKKHREIIIYAVAGIITTGVNWVIYTLLVSLCGAGINISNTIAWFAAVFAAFFLNKGFVFQQKDWRLPVILHEGLLFFCSRILSGILEIGLVPVLMALGVTQSILGVKGFAAKFLAGAVAMILSYFLSKYGVFQKPKQSNVGEMPPICVEYHADDYGMFPTQSQRILSCHENGVLNAVSVIPNSPYLRQCMEQIFPKKDIAIAVHLNLMEGHSISDPTQIPLLVDEKGVFSATFGKLLLVSYLPRRSAYREQLRVELKKQIYMVSQHLGDGIPLRIDGHAHYHMIPIVFDALMDVIEENQLSVSYIRFPKEYLRLYLKNYSKLTGLRPINLIKVFVLNVLTYRNQRKYRAFTSRLEQRIFLGVLFSGNMCTQNVQAVLPVAKTLAEQLHQGIEILAHPGGVYENEDILQLTHKDDVVFLTSKNREKEANMFSELDREII